MKYSDIPVSKVGEGQPRFLIVQQVARHLKKMKKKTKSRVRGDIPKAVVNKYTNELEAPLSWILNESL